MAKAKKKSKAKKSSKKAAKKKSKKLVKRAAAKAKRSPAKKSKKTTPRKAAKKIAKKPAKKVAPKKKKQIVGEGDYAASRKFLKEQADFVKTNKAKIPEMGKAAEAALDGPEGDSLREAEHEAMKGNPANE